MLNNKKSKNNACRNNLHLYGNNDSSSSRKFVRRNWAESVTHTPDKMFTDDPEKHKLLEAEAKRYEKRMNQKLVAEKLGRRNALFYLDY